MQENKSPIVKTATFISIVCGLSSLAASLATTAAEPTGSLDQHITAAMHRWQVPGLALVVVKDGKAIRMKGYGTRQHERKLDIDKRTYFPIASNTKAFTAYTIGMLVDDGKMKWDDPVKKHIPELSLPDSHVEAQIWWGAKN